MMDVRQAGGWLLQCLFPREESGQRSQLLDHQVTDVYGMLQVLNEGVGKVRVCALKGMSADLQV